MRTNRRQFLKASAAALLPLPAVAQGAGPQVAVIGGGFAGASAARFLKREYPAAKVTLVEANPTFTACPFSNGVLAGLRDLRAQQFSYENIESDGVVLAKRAAAEVDAQARSVTLAGGAKLSYDRLVMALRCPARL
jgi:sulfide dehydrogenase [flavocytochrome c] flavoprotein subunit